MTRRREGKDIDFILNPKDKILIQSERLCKLDWLVHAGWKGTLQKITSMALDKLTERGSIPGDIIVWIGPAIGICCYIVSKELAKEFGRQFPQVPYAVQGRYIDLKEINTHQLKEKGVPRKNIMISEYCTQCSSELFYSYRGMGAFKGRIVNAAMLL